MLYLVSYDIVDTSQRTRLAKRLLNFGKRVQYSVFECQLEPQQLEQMKQQALPFVDLEQDSLRLYRLCENCAASVESFGVKKGWEAEDTLVV
ncbi:MAG: CRISPR-associated endonuclease Cas2 [bacterium]|nr:CRISPR-associated endonuclease Cas2 [bacterium]